MRLWQFFFTGWGLVMVAALVAGALFTKQLLWTPISAINMTDVISNQFKMQNATFDGTDRDGAPFHLHARVARQEYDTPDIVYMDDVTGHITQTQDGAPVRRDISASHGRYSRAQKKIFLNGNVRINSSDGNKILTKELVIKI